MPYIICTNMPGCLPEQEPHAAATLEEARGAACNEIERTPMTATDETRLLRDAMSLPESGGVIGPLSDGYVIDVQRVTWSELRDLAGLTVTGIIRAIEAANARSIVGLQQKAQGYILDAYNGRTTAG